MINSRRSGVEEERLCISDSDPPWTSSRCQRLLRPLTSKIALLRKIKTVDSSEICKSSPNASIDASLGSSTLAQHLSKVRDLDLGPQVVDPIDDAGWTEIARPRKKLRRTYSGKSRPEISTSTTDSGSKPTTKTSAEAILRLFGADSEIQALVHDDDKKFALNPLQVKEPVFPRNPEPGSIDLAAQRRAFTDLAKLSCPSHWQIMAGLYDSLAALLKATAEDQPIMIQTSDMSIPRKSSTSSVLCEEKRPGTLFGTCLRKVPTLIMMEQRSLKLEDPENDVDVSSTIYSDLEQLNCSNTVGWKPLKEVVRAHGIVILTDAIQEFLISSHIGSALMRLCITLGACHEAAKIVEAMTTNMEILETPASTDSLLFNYHTSITLHAMNTLRLKTQSFRFMYIQLAKLLKTKKVPLEWITAQDMVDIWKRVVLDVTQGRHDATEAVALLRVAFAIGRVKTEIWPARAIHELRIKSYSKYRAAKKKKSRPMSQRASELAPDEKIEGEKILKRTSQTLSSLLTVACAIGLLDPSKTFIVTEIGQQAQQLTELTNRSLLYDIDPDSFALSMLTSAISSAKTGLRSLRTLDQAFSQTTPDFAATAGSFLSNVAQCCGRVTARDPYEHLHCFMRCLGSRFAENSEYEALRSTYSAICVAAAFALAEKSGRPKHMEGAVTLDLRLQSGNTKQAFRTPGKTPAQQGEGSRTGFRWEEGISEWVAQTPLGPLNNPCGDNSEVDKSGHEVLSLLPDTRQTVPELGNIGETSPCAKRHIGLEAKGEIRLKRKRGRPKKNETGRKSEEPEEVDKSKSFEIFSDEDEDDAAISTQQSCSQNLHELHEVLGNAKCRTEVLRESKGAADAVFRAKATSLTDGTESEDELSLTLV